MQKIGQLASTARYPVKSMAGETIEQARLTEHGLEYDRLYAFESSGAPAGMLRLTGKERREMLRYRPHLLPDGTVEVETPAGERYAVGSPEMLAHLQANIPGASLLSLTREPTPQTDVRPLSLISLQTVSQLSQELDQPLDARRFRMNLTLDLAEPFAEDALVGRTLRIGETATILIRERCPRCRFVTYDPGAPHTAEPLFDLMKLLDRKHQGRAGVYASVLVPGLVVSGDTVSAD